MKVEVIQARTDFRHIQRSVWTYLHAERLSHTDLDGFPSRAIVRRRSVAGHAIDRFGADWQANQAAGGC